MNKRKTTVKLNKNVPVDASAGKVNGSLIEAGIVGTYTCGLHNKSQVHTRDLPAH